MRNIKKSIKVKKVEITFYDKLAKEERISIYTMPETYKAAPIPDNCVVLDEKVLEEKEVVYSMSPETFVEYATILEK